MNEVNSTFCGSNPRCCGAAAQATSRLAPSFYYSIQTSLLVEKKPMQLILLIFFTSHSNTTASHLFNPSAIQPEQLTKATANVNCDVAEEETRLYPKPHCVCNTAALPRERWNGFHALPSAL